jgi:SEC-C motif-containing protein
MSACPCGSQNPFDDCCRPYIDGQAEPPTAEALMRARYSAFATAASDFIMSTLHPDHRDDVDAGSIRRWAENAQWLGLEIRSLEKGTADDESGSVEFVAHYMEKGVRQRHHERAEFKKEDGRWFFVDGQPVPVETVVRSAPKVGRNDPCPCGSGKKYKKCCAA